MPKEKQEEIPGKEGTATNGGIAHRVDLSDVG